MVTCTSKKIDGKEVWNLRVKVRNRKLTNKYKTCPFLWQSEVSAKFDAVLVQFCFDFSRDRDVLRPDIPVAPIGKQWFKDTISDDSWQGIRDYLALKETVVAPQVVLKR
jgi:hypothetical protein